MFLKFVVLFWHPWNCNMLHSSKSATILLNALLYFVIQNLNDIFSEIWDLIIFLLPEDKHVCK